MPSHWEQVVVHAEDPARLARWWAEALGYPIVREAPGRVEVRRGPDGMPGLLFAPVPDGRHGRSRLHLDLRPDDQESEVERLVDMGARLVGTGPGAAGWVMLADPEGNEFCVLAARTVTDQPGAQDDQSA